ncbi:MAG: BACON domain-containing protein [Blastocatellia bacterium]
MKRARAFFFILCIIVSTISAHVIAARQAPPVNSQAQASSEARGFLDSAVTVHAAGRMNPFINLRDGHGLPVDYQGNAQAVAALRNNSAPPLALCSADFDEDGMPDLVTGYAGNGGGLIVMQRGDVDAVYPNTPDAVAHQAQMRAVSPEAATPPSPFLLDANITAVAVAPQFMAAGDFDADGHADLITCDVGAAALAFLKGDGRGSLSVGKSISLPGKITAITVADVNRMDGLADIVVAVTTAGGARLLVFEDRFGALQAEPDSIDLPAAATALAVAQLDDSYPLDIVAACGRDLLIVHGRDRHGATLAGQADDANQPSVTRVGLAYNIAALAAGDLLGDYHTELAALAGDGVCHILAKASNWQEAAAVQLPVSQKQATSTLSPSLLAVRLSSSKKADLLFVDRAAARLQFALSDAAESTTTAQAMHYAGTLDVEGAPVTVLPMRLNSDGLDDLVVLRAGASLPTALTSAPLTTYTVMNTDDSGSGSLRQAILDANQNAGADSISFNIAGSGVQTINLLSALPSSFGVVTIDGTTQSGFSGTPLIELNGSGAGDLSVGLNITAGSSVVRGLVINRFDGTGISLGGDNNHVEGCYIGTSANGSSMQGNGEQGVSINNNSNNTVGGTTAAARNVISGSSANGVLVLGSASGNLIQGNYIGTNAAGTGSFGNAGDGIEMVSGGNSVSNCTIGGTTAGAGNVISGNNGSGIQFFGVGTGNLIQGNLIGLSATGTQSVGNSLVGVVVTDATSTTIGGSVATARNVISGNGTEGVRINDATANHNFVKGNYIGTKIDGVTPQPNGADGIFLLNSANNNQIGGVTGEGNLIAYNLGAGVGIETGTGNAILTNTITANHGLGIDLAPDGVNANDTGDGDSGPNNLQNYPVLQTANSLVGGGATVQGTLNSTASATFTIQFFANDSCNSSSNGEGQIFLGSTSVMTNGSGNATINATLPTAATSGQSITATATDAQGNTSEFSACIAYGAADLSVAQMVSPSPALAGTTVTYTITVTNNGPDAAQAITVTDNLPATVVFVNCSASGGTCGGSGNNRTISFASLASGAMATATITATVGCNVTNGAMVDNTASASATTRDPASGNNSATASFTASNPPATLSPTGETFSSDGGTASVQVTLTTNCPWTAQSNANWIIITSTSGGSGSGPLGYSVGANNTGQARQGTMTIAGQTFTVNQTNTPCQQALSPASAVYAAAGGSGSVNVTALVGCSWAPVSHVAWITTTGSGSGNGTFNYTVLANPDPGLRTGTVTVGTATFTVTQNPASCVFTLSPVAKLMNAVGNQSSFDLLCGAGCVWTATASDNWIVITTAASGNGPATIRFVVRDNFSANVRQGGINVAGQTLSIVQAGSGQPDCTFLLSAGRAHYGADGGDDSVQLTAIKSCAWEAVSSAGWVRITSPTAGSGSETVNFHVDANTSPSGRAATLRIGGQTFKIKQAGCTQCTAK